MGDHIVTFTRSARKELETLDASMTNRVFSSIETLAREPRPRGCHKLHAEEDLWRIRVGEYRVIYAIHDKEQVVDIVAVRHRSRAYR